MAEHVHEDDLGHGSQQGDERQSVQFGSAHTSGLAVPPAVNDSGRDSHGMTYHVAPEALLRPSLPSIDLQHRLENDDDLGADVSFTSQPGLHPESSAHSQHRVSFNDVKEDVNCGEAGTHEAGIVGHASRKKRQDRSAVKILWQSLLHNLTAAGAKTHPMGCFDAAIRISHSSSIPG